MKTCYGLWLLKWNFRFCSVTKNLLHSLHLKVPPVEWVRLKQNIRVIDWLWTILQSSNRIKKCVLNVIRQWRLSCKWFRADMANKIGSFLANTLLTQMSFQRLHTNVLLRTLFTFEWSFYKMKNSWLYEYILITTQISRTSSVCTNVNDQVIVSSEHFVTVGTFVLRLWDQERK